MLRKMTNVLMRRRGLTLFLASAGIFLYSVCAVTDQAYCGLIAGKSIGVRVAIMQNSVSFTLKVKGEFSIVDAKSKQVLYRGNNLFTTVTGYNGGIMLGTIRTRSELIEVEAPDPVGISIDGRFFRDSIFISRKSNGRFQVVNTVNLEDYVKGILYHEASHYWPMEVLKAQAVVSRTYAVYQMKENTFRDFDVTSDIYSQVYGGKTSERIRTNRAVLETSGLILRYNNEVLPAYFHATCAGHTENSSSLWNTSLEPLKGVPCSFCKESPHYNWSLVLSVLELKDKLVQNKRRFKKISSIEAVSRNESGRVVELRIASDDVAMNIPAKELREILNPNLLRSTKFDVKIVNGDAVFTGEGWGHGVGLCQWGAYFMAKDGRRFDEILSYYYPGTDLGPLVNR